MSLNTIVTTNLRIDATDWQRVKVLAAEMDISVNELVKKALQEFTSHHVLGVYKLPDQKSLRLHDFPLRAQQMVASSKDGQLSDDDKIIYGVQEEVS